MKIGNYQLISSLLAGVLVVVGTLLVASSSPVSAPQPVNQQSSGSQLEVRDATGTPGSTSELLQGAASDQGQAPQNDQIEQPSTDLLHYLQPNSGQSNFNTQDSDVQ